MTNCYVPEWDRSHFKIPTEGENPKKSIINCLYFIAGIPIF
jgi:hypothetical protein